MPDKNLAPQANTRAVLGKRVQDCSSTNNHFINYLGVDFFEYDSHYISRTLERL
jgi:hypothetical protein